jgi:hypothetical protein
MTGHVDVAALAVAVGFPDLEKWQLDFLDFYLNDPEADAVAPLVLVGGRRRGKTLLARAAEAMRDRLSSA